MRITSVFVVLTALALVTATVGAVAAPADSDRPGAVAVDVDVPEPDSFEAPETDGVAVVGGEEYEEVQAAVDAADPGDTVRLRGRFDERIEVRTPNLTLTAASPSAAMIDGGGDGDVLAIEAGNVTVEHVWVRNSGWNADAEDAAVFVNGSDVTLRGLRLTEVTFGVWVDGVDRVLVENSTIVGREGVSSHAERGNGIQLWETEDTVVRGNDITRVRDGIYFSWAEGVLATDNRLWNLRYGVHYMYSDGNRLSENLAFDNDVGYALMVSSNLEIVDNVAVNNRGQSGHGILVKDVEDSTIRGNVVAGNEHGFYVSNSKGNLLADNLVLENSVGIHATAGSTDQTVVNNSFIENDVQAFTTREAVVAWNSSKAGNYWSDARTVDLSNDGVSETRHRTAGTVERLRHDKPAVGAFVGSPAFRVVRLVEDSFPLIESPGIVDHHPLTTPPHEGWRRYYADGQGADTERRQADVD